MMTHTGPVFIGRQLEMERISKLLEQGGCILLTGDGGVGKTVLSLHLTHQLQSRFHETVWMDCELKPSLGDIVLMASVALMGDSARSFPIDERHQRLIDFLQQNPCLLVLDNFDSIAKDSDLKRWMMSIALPSAVLLIARQSVPALNVPKYMLRELLKEDAVKLFTHRASQCGWEGEDAEFVPQLCEQVKNLPLAIILLAGCSSKLPLPNLSDIIARSLNAPVSEDNPLRGERHQSIAVCSSVSYDRLSIDAQLLLKRLSLLPGGVGEQMIGPFTKIVEWEAPVAECVQCFLLDFDGHRYRFHPLLRSFLQHRLGDDFSQWRDHFVKFFAKLVEENEDINDLSKTSALDTEWLNLLGAAKTAQELKDWEDIPSSLGRYMKSRGLWLHHERIRMNRDRLSTNVESHLAVIPIMVVDDHEIWRDGVRSMLKNTEFEVVEEAASGREALDKIAGIHPRLVLLDIRMAGGDGFETLTALKNYSSQLSVIMLTTYSNPTYMARAVAGGASGYLLKNVKRQELLNVLRTVASGETLISREDLVHSLRCVGEKDYGSKELAEPLTPREIEVLRLLATGLSNRDIAALLFIGEGSVKTYVEHIIGKLAVSDRVQAAVWAAQMGLVQTL